MMFALSLSDDASKSDHGKALQHLRRGASARDFWVEGRRMKCLIGLSAVSSTFISVFSRPTSNIMHITALRNHFSAADSVT